jgi:hypothetical protein
MPALTYSQVVHWQAKADAYGRALYLFTHKPYLEAKATLEDQLKVAQQTVEAYHKQQQTTGPKPVRRSRQLPGSRP